MNYSPEKVAVMVSKACDHHEHQLCFSILFRITLTKFCECFGKLVYCSKIMSFQSLDRPNAILVAGRVATGQGKNYLKVGQKCFEGSKFVTWCVKMYTILMDIHLTVNEWLGNSKMVKEQLRNGCSSCLKQF